MNKDFRIVATSDQLQQGLFGQVFLWVFEILPYLDNHHLKPDWAIHSALYGRDGDGLVIPGLLELNYQPDTREMQDVNIQQFREKHLVTLGNDWEYVSSLWNKFFRLPESVVRKADELPSLEGALGLHYRGTDKNTSSLETNYVSEDDFLKLTSDFISTHPDIRTVFIATDENAFVTKVRAQHPTLEILNTGEVTHHKDLHRQDNFAKGEHALLDCFLLSRCRYLVKCQSALSAFSKVLNPNLETYRISANKMAYWSMGAPYFPDGYLPVLTSHDPECQKILARLMADDWTEDYVAMKRYGKKFCYRNRKRYMRRTWEDGQWGFPLRSWDGIHWRIDKRITNLRNRLRI